MASVRGIEKAPALRSKKSVKNKKIAKAARNKKMKMVIQYRRLNCKLKCSKVVVIVKS